MFKPRFVIDGFGKSPDANVEILYCLLDCLVRINVGELKRNPSIPSLYASGVKYVREPYGQENWSDVREVYKRRFGDCEDLSAWRAAELITRGVQAAPHVAKPKIAGGGRVLLYHIQVKLPNGEIDDPSARLGMKRIT